MPGHLRWGLIAPYATSHRAAEVAGVLYDTHQGWPAARFRTPLAAPVVADGGPPEADASIPGWLVELAASGADDLLAQLDEVEGAVVVDHERDSSEQPPAGVTSAEYRRVRVRTLDGIEAWAYEASVVLPTWTAVPRWTAEIEN